ncbi:fibronectin-binding protein RevA [Borreliella burgdorferi]|uniref:fibronectin-binding protein RevA n=1 Tax=Borreliella burgdorferi TaxID=139 RepID=UPI000D03329E|nr:fibronectin-binding protein RevA [Borreliella burgdorferi]PRR25597.1 REV family protein [Borreliella burgdorferi]
MQKINIAKLIFILIFSLFVMSCELFLIKRRTSIVGTSIVGTTIEKTRINRLIMSVSGLDDQADEVVFKNCREKISLLKEDLKYATNAKEFEEKFLNLQKLFQEKLTSKLNALKAVRVDIQRFNANNNNDLEKDKLRIRSIALSAGVNTSPIALHAINIKELSEDVVAHIDSIIKYLEED